MSSKAENAEDTLDELLTQKARIEEVSSSEDEQTRGIANGDARDDIDLPPWLAPAQIDQLPDGIVTKTLQVQLKTQSECLPFLTLRDTQGLALNTHGMPHLTRDAHIRFLYKVFEPMPAAYQVVDASRPWLFYWSLMGLTALGEDVSPYRERLVETLRPLQNSTGGFGGGHGQYSHCATSYGCTLALAMVGGLELIDRKAMWNWLGQVKQADGGFKVAVMAEEDIRGAYCALTIISLLNLPLELPANAPARENGLTSFLDSLGMWIGRCQTFEGGIAAAPSNEAHGAYAFCALGCLSIIDAPHLSIPKYLDTKALLSWLASVQTTPEGGFAGRTNKLVDACYSHWVGGCWALLEAAFAGSDTDASKTTLWNREGLIRYLLTCCQQPGKRGGMRDKPSARPDAYHTCYSVAGLSAAMNHYRFEGRGGQFDSTGRLAAPFQWSAEGPSQDEREGWGIDVDDVVRFVHPVYVVPFETVVRTQAQFEKGGFQR